MARTSKTWIWLPLAAALLPCFLMADVTGSILGVVTDPSAAVMQGVRVTATNVDTNQSTETTSDAAGQYRILSLPIGRYKVEATFAGFQTFVATGVVLSVNEQRRVDIVLQVGATQQEVSVNANAAPGRNHEYAIRRCDRRKEDPGTAAQRPELHRSVRPANRRGARQYARRRSRNDLRERPAGKQQRLPGERRRCVRRRQFRGGRPAQSGCGARVPVDHQQFRRRIRAIQRRAHEHHHQERNQPHPRHGVRIPSK